MFMVFAETSHSHRSGLFVLRLLRLDGHILVGSPELALA